MTALSPTAPGAIPHQRSPLIGREQELDDLESILHARSDRLITLTGPGGVGKTRLAIEIAGSVTASGASKAHFIPLAHVTTSDDVLTAIAHVASWPDRPVGEPLESVLRAIGTDHYLLVLDNLEQVPEIGPALAAILSACPNLVILATSQVRLRVSGEREYVIGTMPVGDTSGDAVRLFVDRATAADARFALTDANTDQVMAICAALGGLPLAIELAAARIKLLSPADLLSRLDRQLSILTGGGGDLPQRQQTMRNAIAWSYDLLQPDEQAFLRGIAVFVNGFALDEVDAFAPADATALDLLGSLIDKSLVYRAPSAGDESRYGMFASIREYAAEQRASLGEEAATREKHAFVMLQRADTALVARRHPGADRWIPILEADLANFRLAIDWWHTSGDFGRGLIHVSRLSSLWDLQSLSREARQRYEEFWPALDSLGPEDQIPAIRGYSVVLMRLAEFAAAGEVAEVALQKARDLGDDQLIIDCVNVVGGIAAESGRFDECIECFMEVLERSRRIGYERGISTATHNMGLVEFARGDVGRGRQLQEDALAMDRLAGNHFQVINGLSSLAMTQLQAGDLPAAAASLSEILDLSAEHDFEVEGTSFGMLAAFTGQFEDAAILVGSAYAAAERAGGQLLSSNLAARIYGPMINTILEELGDDEYAIAEQFGRSLTPDDVAERSRSVIAQAQLSAGRPVEAAPARDAVLSARELDVIRLLARGKTNNEIAELLFISLPTVKVHVRSILTKLNVSTRTAAAAYAINSAL